MLGDKLFCRDVVNLITFNLPRQFLVVSFKMQVNCYSSALVVSFSKHFRAIASHLKTPCIICSELQISKCESSTVFLGFVNILVSFQLVMKDEFDIALVNRSSSKFIEKERWIKTVVRQ